MKYRFAFLSSLAGLLMSLPGASAAPLTADPAPESWCTALRTEISRLKWKLDPCPRGVKWIQGAESVKGRPIVYAEFGDSKATNTTLILSMVHGDEITPLYIGLQLANWMHENRESLTGTRVVIAPLVNPDGFYVKPRTRVNARGVDVNRNFSTRDWPVRATKAWATRFKKDPRRFPGSEPNSEPETLFQTELIRLVRPHKILSIHSPLNFTDYDGPNLLQLERFPKEYVQECLKLRKAQKAVHGGFYPGSLGNYAGQELGIPTITLELPSSDARKAHGYWERFQTGIRGMIEFRVPDYAVRRLPEHDTVARNDVRPVADSSARVRGLAGSRVAPRTN